MLGNRSDHMQRNIITDQSHCSGIDINTQSQRMTSMYLWNAVSSKSNLMCLEPVGLYCIWVQSWILPESICFLSLHSYMTVARPVPCVQRSNFCQSNNVQFTLESKILNRTYWYCVQQTHDLASFPSWIPTRKDDDWLAFRVKQNQVATAWYNTARNQQWRLSNRPDCIIPRLEAGLASMTRTRLVWFSERRNWCEWCRFRFSLSVRGREHWTRYTPCRLCPRFSGFSVDRMVKGPFEMARSSS